MDIQFQLCLHEEIRFRCPLCRDEKKPQRRIEKLLKGAI